jgi:hypothetical protein
MADIGQANAMAMIHEHPAPFDGNRQSFNRHVIQVGRQQPPARPAICGVIQGAHQVTGERFAAAADFCSSGPAASSFAPPLLTASTTDSTTTWVAAAAAAPNAVPATVFTASAALLMVLFFAMAYPSRCTN